MGRRGSGPHRLFSWLSSDAHVSDRKLRLLACARRVLHLANKKRARQAVEAAELYADGHLSEAGLRRARRRAEAAAPGISPATAKRYRAVARAWLFSALSEPDLGTQE